MNASFKCHMAAEILQTKTFRQRFMHCVSHAPTTLRVVSPFIGELPVYKDIVNFCRFVQRFDDCTLQLVTRPPTPSTDTITLHEAEAIVKLGVDLLIRTSPTLHSKIYYFEFKEGNHTAFIGSSNFTIGGFKRNDETMAMLRDRIDARKVRAELDRLSGRGSQPYLHWKAWSKQTKRRLPHG